MKPDESTVIASSDDDIANFQRTPRPPIRRRNRSTPAAPRPKSTSTLILDVRNNSGNKRFVDFILTGKINNLQKEIYFQRMFRVTLGVQQMNKIQVVTSKDVLFN